MTVSADSRYATGTLTTVLLPDGNGNVMLQPPAIAIEGVSFTLYILQSGDRYDLLATQFFQDPTKWWVIADMNPEIIWPADLVPGRAIRIPYISAGADTFAPAVGFQ